MTFVSTESELLERIFSKEKEWDSEEASRRLLQILCSPGGMEAFVHDFKRKLVFNSITIGGLDGFLVYSSMTPDGKFVSDQGGVIWQDSGVYPV